MTKPDFKQMTRKELKSYIRQHPTDDEAIRELFISRRHPDAKVYPNSVSPDEIEQAILDYIKNKQNKENKISIIIATSRDILYYFAFTSIILLIFSLFFIKIFSLPSITTEILANLFIIFSILAISIDSFNFVIKFWLKTWSTLTGKIFLIIGGLLSNTIVSSYSKSLIHSIIHFNPTIFPEFIIIINLIFSFIFLLSIALLVAFTKEIIEYILNIADIIVYILFLPLVLIFIPPIDYIRQWMTNIFSAINGYFLFREKHFWVLLVKNQKMLDSAINLTRNKEIIDNTNDIVMSHFKKAWNKVIGIAKIKNVIRLCAITVLFYYTVNPTSLIIAKNFTLIQNLSTRFLIFLNYNDHSVCQNVDSSDQVAYFSQSLISVAHFDKNTQRYTFTVQNCNL